jgi:pimeloyl-ACP methyl ester carboxylesterase
MGGMIAQELAMRHPELVTRLVLVGTRPPTPAQIASDPAVLAAAMRPPRRGVPLATHYRASWTRLTPPGFADAHPEVIDEVVAQILRRPTPRAGVLAQMRAIAGWHGAHRCARIQAPTVVVHGNRDPIMPVGNGARLAHLIPDATHLELPGAGHLVPHEAGSMLARVLEQTSVQPLTWLRR